MIPRAELLSVAVVQSHAGSGTIANTITFSGPWFLVAWSFFASAFANLSVAHVDLTDGVSPVRLNSVFDPADSDEQGGGPLNVGPMPVEALARVRSNVSGATDVTHHLAFLVAPGVTATVT